MHRQWLAGMRQLARRPNVFVKLGGMAIQLWGFALDQEPLPPSSGELVRLWRPYMEPAIELFGAQRCMFESNFPADKGSCSYVAVWNAFKRLTAAASPAERDALFRGTAQRIYRPDRQAAR